MGQDPAPKTPPADPSRRDFFRKLLKGAQYTAPTVMVVSMANLMQGQSSTPHPKMHGM